MCVKTKELGPVGMGGVRRTILYVHPPMLTSLAMDPQLHEGEVFTFLMEAVWRKK